jgi:antitoxin HigA-1
MTEPRDHQDYLADMLEAADKGVTAETALRLARYFDTTPQFWLGLQADYDLDVAAEELGERLDHEIRGHALAV